MCMIDIYRAYTHTFLAYSANVDSSSDDILKFQLQLIADLNSKQHIIQHCTAASSTQLSVSVPRIAVVVVCCRALSSGEVVVYEPACSVAGTLGITKVWYKLSLKTEPVCNHHYCMLLTATQSSLLHNATAYGNA
jgi:hypothetical protein